MRKVFLLVILLFTIGSCKSTKVSEPITYFLPRAVEEELFKIISEQKEIDYCFSKSNAVPYLAARFAIKEAAIKAMGQRGVDIFYSDVLISKIDNGSIKFDGTEVSELPVPVVAKLGLLRTFQQTRIYGKLNCIENMLISAKPVNDGIFTVFQKIPGEFTDKAETLLKFVGLHQKRKLRAGDLSFGQQKLLELAAVNLGLLNL